MNILTVFRLFHIGLWAFIVINSSASGHEPRALPGEETDHLGSELTVVLEQGLAEDGVRVVVDESKGSSVRVEGLLVELVRSDPDLAVRTRALFRLSRQREPVDRNVDALLVELIRRGESESVALMTEVEACGALSEWSALAPIAGDHNLPVLIAAKRMAALAAALWLRDHAESKSTIPVLADALASGEDGRGAYVSPMFAAQGALGPLTAALSEALATLGSRFSEVSGGLSVAESQDAGALSVAEQGAKLALADEGGQLSLVDEEARRKKLAARARQKR